MSDVLDALRGYVQLATGLTEVTVSKAREAAAALIAQGVDLAAASREVPGGDTAKAAATQVQDLADDLLETSKQNREMLTSLVRTEVDRAAGRMGFVREEELAAVRRHVSRLESQLADIRAEIGGTPAKPGDELFFDQPVLRDFERLRAGAHRYMPRQEAHGIDRHILELDRNGIARRGKGDEARFVVPRRVDMVRGNLRRDALTLGGVAVHLIAELRRGDREHAAELAAAQDTDRRTRCQQAISPREPGSGRRCWSACRARRRVFAPDRCYYSRAVRRQTAPR